MRFSRYHILIDNLRLFFLFLAAIGTRRILPIILLFLFLRLLIIPFESIGRSGIVLSINYAFAICSAFVITISSQYDILISQQLRIILLYITCRTRALVSLDETKRHINVICVEIATVKLSHLIAIIKKRTIMHHSIRSIDKAKNTVIILAFVVNELPILSAFATGIRLGVKIPFSFIVCEELPSEQLAQILIIRHKSPLHHSIDIVQSFSTELNNRLIALRNLHIRRSTHISQNASEHKICLFRYGSIIRTACQVHVKINIPVKIGVHGIENCRRKIPALNTASLIARTYLKGPIT